MSRIGSAMRGVCPITVTVAVLSCCGCVVGPDFERPAPPAIVNYGEKSAPTRLIAAASGGDQEIVAASDLPREWWRLFHSPQLDQLVRIALANNPTVEQAQATLRQARNLTEVSRAGLLPTVSANLSRDGTLASINDISVTASYVPDVFGGIRRSIEARKAEQEVAAFELRSAELTLTGSIVTAALEEAAWIERIVVSRSILRSYLERLQLLKIRHAAGTEPIASVLTQESLIQSQQALIVTYEAERDQTRHQLAILSGQPPSEYRSGSFTLAELRLPRKLPLSLPSRLVERRPDIRVAEARLHAASAEIGVATANLLPTLTLSAGANFNGSIASLAASSAWPATMALAQPLLDGGALRARRQAAVEAYTAERASYRTTVLAALQNVADALTELEADARALTAATQAEELARRALAAATIQHRAGVLTYADLLQTQAQYASARLTRLNRQTQRLLDTATLFKVLGGGWG